MSAKLILATLPAARMLRMRSAKVGSSCDGSTRLKSVRLGSTPETTASVAISSPSARTTAVTALFLMRMCWTSACVRISAPAARADSASARVRAPSPPFGIDAEPTGCGSAAARSKKDGGAAGGPRAESGAEDSARGDGGAEEFGVEKFGDEIGDGHRSPTQKIEHAFFAEAADVTAGLEEIPEIFGRRRIDRGRSDRGDLAENFGNFGEGFGEFGVVGGVFRGEARDAAGGFGVIVVEEERAAVGRRSEDARIGIEDLQILLVEAHVARDVGAKRADGVRERRGAIARVKFFGDGAAADNFAAFENDGFESALGEIESGDECVVSAADDDYALSDGHVQFFSLSGAMVESDGALATSSAVSGAAFRVSVSVGSSFSRTRRVRLPRQVALASPAE